MTHLIRMSIRTDRMNKTRHSRSRQKTHRMQIIWEQEQLLCMPRTRMYPDLIKKEVSLEAITPETVLSQLAAAGVLPSDTTVLSFTKKEKDGEQVIDLDLSESLELTLKRWDLPQNIW